MAEVMGERSRVIFRSPDGRAHTVMVVHLHDSPAVPGWCKPLSSLLINLGMAGFTLPRVSGLPNTGGHPGGPRLSRLAPDALAHSQCGSHRAIRLARRGCPLCRQPPRREPGLTRRTRMRERADWAKIV